MQGPPTVASDYKVQVVIRILCAIILFLLGVGAGYVLRQHEVDVLHNEIEVRQKAADQASAAMPTTSESKQKTLGAMNAIATQLEVYYNDHGAYPSLVGQLNNDTWVTQNLKDLNFTLLRPAGASSNAMQDTSEPDQQHLGYKTYEEDGATPCTAALCPKFELYGLNQVDGSILVKNSLN